MPGESARLRRLWSETRWILLGLAWLIGLALGAAGLRRYAVQNALDWSTGDILYQALQMIPISSAAIGGTGNWMLETARFLLPVLAGYTALQALMHLFQEQMQLLRLWTVRDHTIVCGLGRRGGHLAEDLLALGRRVVAIEREPESTRAAELRQRGAIVLEGDATDRELLARARADRARTLVCLLEQDRQNLQAAFQAYRLTRGRRRGTLTCIVHLASPDLVDLVKRSELSIDAEIPFQIETFHPYPRAARILIQEDPDWQEDADPSSMPAHLLLIGLGRLGEHLAAQAAYTWHQRRPDEKLTITILDWEAEKKAAALLQRQPQLAAACRLIPLTVDLSAARLLADTLKKIGPPPVQRVYICLGDPVLSLQVCWSLLQRPAFRAAPIRVRIEEKSGLAELLERPGTIAPAAGQVIPFDLYERTCSADLVVGGLHELLARELHEGYLAALGAESGGAPWDHLPEAVKEDNRQQANRIHRLLTAAGYEISPFQEWSASGFAFQPEEVERMARSEHEQWRRAKEADGWRCGPVRDGKARTHPDLVPWEELPEEERAKNVAFVRQLPSLLARAGFQIDRAAEREGGA